MQILFKLLQAQCLSVFTVTVGELRTFTFNVTREDIVNGSARFTLTDLSATEIDVCSVRGVVFGGNDAGNSTTEDIELPSGEARNIIFAPLPYPP